MSARTPAEVAAFLPMAQHALSCAQCHAAMEESGRLGPNGHLGVLFPCDIGLKLAEEGARRVGWALPGEGDN